MGTITRLRALDRSDLDAVFAMMAEPAAVAMAAFTAEDPHDRAAFDTHMDRVLTNPKTVNWAIVDDKDELVGTIAIYPSDEDVLEVTYWIAQPHWGRGHASRALAQALRQTSRPVLARVASDNGASLHVLRNAGFVVIDQGRDYAPGRRTEVDELILKLV